MGPFKLPVNGGGTVAHTAPESPESDDLQLGGTAILSLCCPVVSNISEKSTCENWPLWQGRWSRRWRSRRPLAPPPGVRGPTRTRTIAGSTPTSSAWPRLAAPAAIARGMSTSRRDPERRTSAGRTELTGASDHAVLSTRSGRSPPAASGFAISVRKPPNRYPRQRKMH